MSIIPGYVTPAEVADQVGLSVSQISRYITSGELKVAKRLGRMCLIEEAVAKNFVKKPRGNPNFQKKVKKSRRRSEN